MAGAPLYGWREIIRGAFVLSLRKQHVVPALTCIRRWPWQSERWVTLKILCRNPERVVTSETELDISRRITGASSKGEGALYLRTVLDSFMLAGPHGTHLGLVYEPMRESLSRFQRRLPDGRIPAYFLKPLLTMILTGIDYLHRACDIIHTGMRENDP
jgi:serine/threonine-protein kinase SRPK3